MKKAFYFIFFLISVSAVAQSKDEAAIRKLLARQSNDWNNGNIAGFMEGYWKNDSLMFIGKSGITYGWNNTLSNYKKGYPDTAAMGKLNFTILKVKRLSNKNYWVVGKWFLKRSIGDVGGYFDLLFEKVNGEWVIIADHSS
jgi:hypothetical protein